MGLVSALMMAAAVSAVPLEPMGKWTVDYAPNACTLDRSFGDPTSPVTLSAIVLPFGDTIDLLIAQKDGPSDVRMGTASLTIDDRAPIGVPFQGYPSREGRKVIRMTVPRTIFSDMPARSIVKVVAQGFRVTPIAVTGAPSASAALDRCNDDTAKRWGLDPGERARVAVQPAGVTPPGDWITHNDYPTEALLRGHQGTTVILWAIDTEGRVTDCRTVVSSGSPLLDAAGCQAVVKRGRYTPALGADGKPMAVHQTRKIVWLMPTR